MVNFIEMYAEITHLLRFRIPEEHLVISVPVSDLIEEIEARPEKSSLDLFHLCILHAHLRNSDQFSKLSAVLGEMDEVLYRKAVCKKLYLEGNFRGCISGLRKLPVDPENRMVIAMCQFRMGRSARALALFEELERQVEGSEPGPELALGQRLYYKAKINQLKIGPLKELKRYEAALKSFVQCIDYFQEKDDKANVSICYINKAAVLTELEQFDVALDLNFHVEEILKALNFEDDLAKIYNNIGFCYLRMKEYKKAVTYLTSAYTLCRQLDYREGLAYCCANFGDVFSEQQENKNALMFYFDAAKYARDIGNDVLFDSIMKDVTEIIFNRNLPLQPEECAGAETRDDTAQILHHALQKIEAGEKIDLKAVLNEVTDRLIQIALEINRNNFSHTSRQLGISRDILRTMMKNCHQN